MNEELTENVLDSEKVNLFLETVKGWVPGVINLGIRILIAVILLLVGFKLIKVVRKMVMRSLERAEVEITLRKFLDALLNAVLAGLLVFIAAQQVGMDSASLIAVLGSAGLALGLALQGSLANFAGGVLILLMKPFKVDDYIVTKDGEGTVFAIGLVYTTLTSVDNRKIVIPNGTLANSPLTNVTTMEKRRLDLTVGIGYQADVKKAKDVLYHIYESCDEILKEDGITVYVDSLAESSVILGIRGWVATENYWPVRWKINEEIKLAFDREGIEIPYNYLNVQLTAEK